MTLELTTRVHDRVLLVACGKRVPSEAAFSEFLRASRDSAFDRIWVHTAGGYYDAVQRRRAADVLNRADRVAIMADSALARGAITAFSWLMRGVKGFPGHAYDDARGYLGASAEAQMALQDMVASIAGGTRHAAG